MMVLKSFQDDAVTRGVASFSYLRGLLEQAGEDATSRATAVACHGYILIEAPTGAGKTLIAGSLAERFSSVEKVVWFWFAPFGGLVEQTRLSLRERFAGLQVRELRNDRTVETARSGDVFVTTWATVAVANKDGRKVRQAGEEQPSADEFIPALRAAGFRIGVVVDEAHHGFKKSTQAVAFVKQVLRPDYTVLVTATPNDKDIRVFLDEMHAKEDSLFKIGISRVDAVASGLVKKGLRAIAYLAAEENRGLVDYEKTALAEGVRIHREVERLLKQQGD
jgi:superfamily II DNA or RNA helicase